MKFTRIERPSHPMYWISGIYKITSWDRGEYHAFFIRDGMSNWGDYVATRPDHGENQRCWKSLRSAKAACEEHAKGHTPKPATVKRAAEIKATLMEEAE